MLYLLVESSQCWQLFWRGSQLNIISSVCTRRGSEVPIAISVKLLHSIVPNARVFRFLIPLLSCSKLTTFSCYVDLRLEGTSRRLESHAENLGTSFKLRYDELPFGTAATARYRCSRYWPPRSRSFEDLVVEPKCGDLQSSHASHRWSATEEILTAVPHWRRSVSPCPMDRMAGSCAWLLSAIIR